MSTILSENHSSRNGLPKIFVWDVPRMLNPDRVSDPKNRTDSDANRHRPCHLPITCDPSRVARLITASEYSNAAPSANVDGRRRFQEQE